MCRLCLILCLVVLHVCCAARSLGDVADSTARVDALNAQSREYQWRDYTTSISYADSALALAQQINYKEGIAIAKNLKAFCLWALGENELAVALGLDALKIAEQLGSPQVLAECYLILGRSYMDQDEKAKARMYVSNARQIAERNKNWDQLSRAMNLQGILQFVNKQRDSALVSYQSALQIVEEHKLPRINYPRILSNIGECYYQTDQKTGFEYFYRGLDIAKETGNRTAEASISGIVGQALLKAGDLKNAERYLFNALGLARSMGLRRAVRHAYATIVDLRLKQGRAEEAVEYLRRYYEVRDSLLNTAKTRQIVELEARHELEKKEQAIKLLEKEKEIQSLWRNILFGLLLLVAALAALGMYWLRFREKKNREILNLEIDYLTRQHKEVLEKYKTSLVAEEDKTIDSQDQRLLKKAIEVVEANIGDPLFGVEKMAKEMAMSRTNLHRKIRSVTGFAPSELIRTVRLRKAATMLVNQVDSVSQISIAVGFEDHSYFSKSFKKHFGVTPSEYANSRQYSV